MTKWKKIKGRIEKKEEEKRVKKGGGDKTDKGERVGVREKGRRERE